ncbi:hypothetical protein AJ88_22105 [Mesorhizobium amorphae CCBAU 01583]|nr:hypothetical protein AJ88_22105 [Mesorhizobium amorphae CCBAU 01583]
MTELEASESLGQFFHGYGAGRGIDHPLLVSEADDFPISSGSGHRRLGRSYKGARLSHGSVVAFFVL